MIFVFGSNLRGVHGAGAAKFALENHGAVLGNGVGIQGNSYALPTKDYSIKTLPIKDIKVFVDGLRFWAADHPTDEFQITQIGCGLAGYTADLIAPLFKEFPTNCLFDEAWKPYLGEEKRYWGTL